MRTFLKRNSTTETLTDKLACMFDPVELGPVILRIVKDFSSLQQIQTMPKQLVKLSNRLLLKAHQFFHLQELVKLVTTNNIVTTPSFSMEERLKLCRESLSLDTVVLDEN